MPHRHFSRNERIQLAGFQKAGLPQKETAAALGKSSSGVSRELKKGRAKGPHGVFRYSWKKAERVTRERRTLANQQHRKLGCSPCFSQPANISPAQTRTAREFARRTFCSSRSP